MDSIIQIMDGLIKQSQANYQNNGPKYSNSRWKYCVALSKCGWKATDATPVKNTDEVVIKWQKEGKSELSIRLSFTEQCMWLRYLEETNEQ